MTVDCAMGGRWPPLIFLAMSAGDEDALWAPWALAFQDYFSQDKKVLRNSMNQLRPTSSFR